MIRYRYLSYNNCAVLRYVGVGRLKCENSVRVQTNIKSLKKNSQTRHQINCENLTK